MNFDEEPWEADIGSMLGGLPEVAPPDGFIDGAIDHRPLAAGRTLGALGLATVVAVLGAGFGGLAERGEVVPPLDDLTARHEQVVRAGVIPGTGLDDPSLLDDTPVDLPDDYERTGGSDADELVQAVYARDDESVSVFVQDGRPNWEALDAAGRTEMGGLSAWIDPDNEIAVVEADEQTVTIIGLPPEELDEVVEGLSTEAPAPPLGRARRLAEAIVAPLGFTPSS